MRTVCPYTRLFLLLLIGSLLLSSIPGDRTGDVIRAFNAYHQAVPFEKIYVHTDKNAYTCGEDIWFKGYLVNGQNRPDSLSLVVYAELISEEQEVIQQRLLRVNHSTFKGDFALNDSLPPGTYQIRAYTNYMRNYGGDFFFKKSIPVYSVDSKKYNWQVTTLQPDSATGNDIVYRIQLSDRDFQPLTDVPVEYRLKARGLKNSRGEITPEEDGNYYLSVGTGDRELPESCRLELTIPDEKQQWVFELSLWRHQPVIEFFPEGGNFVADIENRVAFRVRDTRGKGIESEVQLFTGDSVFLATIATNRFGYGVFELMPQQDKTYFANIVHNGVTYERFDLPQAASEGYVMQVDNLDSDRVYINASRNFGFAINAPWEILVQTKGAVVYRLSGVSANGELAGIMPKEGMESGIYQLTLFDQDMIPQCERLIFIQSPQELEVELRTDRVETQNSAERFTIQLSGKEIHTANLSVSVLNTDIVEETFPYGDNIYTNLLLTSELRGRIESPGYYFADDSLKRKHDLDLLLMTHGWRRFVWKELLAGDIPEFDYPVEQAIRVGGVITNYYNNEKEGEEVTLLLFNREVPTVYKDTADAGGEFAFYTHFEGTVEAVFQTRKLNRDRNVERRLILEEHSVPVAGPLYDIRHSNLAEETPAALRESGQTRALVERLYEFGSDYTLDEITVTGHSSVWRHQGKVEPEAVIMVEELEQDIYNRNNFEYSSIFHFLADNYEGIDIYREEDFEYVLYQNRPPYIVLDGRVCPYWIARNIDWRSISKVEILDHGANYYVTNADNYVRPVVCLYSNPDGVTRVRHTGIRRFNLEGYYQAREFSYAVTSEDVNAFIPEYSSTVYWNPELTCDSAGIISFEVPNRYLVKNMQLTIEGLTQNGDPVWGNLNIDTVKN